MSPYLNFTPWGSDKKHRQHAKAMNQHKLEFFCYFFFDSTNAITYLSKRIRLLRRPYINVQNRVLRNAGW